LAASDSAGPWSRHLRDPAVREALANATRLTALHPVGEVGSTQDLALALAADGTASGTVVVADRQVAGRGRGGRRWDDDPGGGTLALTILLEVDDVLVDDLTDGASPSLPLVPHALGLAVMTACSAVAPQVSGIALKWPNDVVWRGTSTSPARKLCGVLVERQRTDGPSGARDVLLCGIGVDVDLRAVEDVPDRVCLATLSGEEPDRPELLATLIRALDDAIALVVDHPQELLERCRRVSDTVGREVRVEVTGRPGLVGLATGIDDTGRLLVTSDGRTHAILSGTIRDAEDDREDPA